MSDSDKRIELLEEIRESIRGMEKRSEERYEDSKREYEDWRENTESSYAKERRSSYHRWLVYSFLVVLIQSLTILFLVSSASTG